MLVTEDAAAPAPTTRRKRMSPFAKLLLVMVPLLAAAGFLLHAFQFAEPAKGKLQIELVKAFPKLPLFDHPLWMGHAGDGTNRIFVVSKPGTIHVFPNDPAVAQAAKFLDITDKVIQWHNEEGLLGLAFDPKFKTNGHFYVHYSRA
ncbi:MAG: PQQ-dependent sugar dehydrogenase, partial [Planctomycetota bacterium]